MQETITVILGESVRQFASLRQLLDWTIIQMVELTKSNSLRTSVNAEAKGEAPKTRAEKVIEIVTGSPAEAKGEEAKPVNSYDLPPMKKAYFPPKAGEADQRLSFEYTINGEKPRVRPADTARVLFVKTKAFADMPQKEKDKVINWGLSFLRKTAKANGKSASVETEMLDAYSCDRFAFLKGAKVTFKATILSQ